MEPFVVKHYGDTPHPVVKGNGFDGLVVGDYREEAEEFVKFINGSITAAQSRISELERMVVWSVRNCVGITRDEKSIVVNVPEEYGAEYDIDGTPASILAAVEKAMGKRCES